MVDLYGEAVQCNITIGDLYRKKHDTFKMRLFQMFERAGMDVEVEVLRVGWLKIHVVCPRNIMFGA